eukprot:COSAG02_NODE_42_length_46522_cov_109.704478_3_plen_311_part_00
MDNLFTLTKEFEELQRRIAVPSDSKAALDRLHAELDGLYERLFVIEDDSDQWHQLDEGIEWGVDQIIHQLSMWEDSDGLRPSTEPELKPELEPEPELELQAYAMRPTIMFSPERVVTRRTESLAGTGTPQIAPGGTQIEAPASPPTSTPGSKDVLAQQRLDVQNATQGVEDARRALRLAALEFERATGEEAGVAQQMGHEPRSDEVDQEWIVLKKATVRSHNHRKGGGFAHCCGSHVRDGGNHNKVGTRKPSNNADGSPGTIVNAKPCATPHKVNEGRSHGGEVVELIDGHFIKVKTAKGKVLCEPVNKK